jgi:hypothetical protein
MTRARLLWAATLAAAIAGASSASSRDPRPVRGARVEAVAEVLKASSAPTRTSATLTALRQRYRPPTPRPERRCSSAKLAARGDLDALAVADGGRPPPRARAPLWIQGAHGRDDAERARARATPGRVPRLVAARPGPPGMAIETRETEPCQARSRSGRRSGGFLPGVGAARAGARGSAS